MRASLLVFCPPAGEVGGRRVVGVGEHGPGVGAGWQFGAGVFGEFVRVDRVDAGVDGGRVDEAEAAGKAALTAAGFGQIDYFDVREASDLSRLGPDPIVGADARILVAAWLGRTRLIDNVAV